MRHDFLIAACCAASISSADAFEVEFTGEEERASETAAPNSVSPTSACTVARMRHASGSPSIASSFLSPHWPTAMSRVCRPMGSLPSATSFGSCASSSAWRAARAGSVTSFEPKPPSFESRIIELPMMPAFSSDATKARYASASPPTPEAAFTRPLRHCSSCAPYCWSTCCAIRSAASVLANVTERFGSFGAISAKKVLMSAATLTLSPASLDLSLPAWATAKGP